MTEGISTGTICPYPFTFANKSSNDISSCTITYGETLDPELLILQSVFGCFFGLVALPIFLRRLYLTSLLAQRRGEFWYESSQAKLYVSAIMLSTSVVVEMIDPYGMRNFVHPYVYFVADGFFISSLFLMAFFIVGFYTSAAKHANFEDGVSGRLSITVVILIFFNFIGKREFKKCAGAHLT